HDSETRLSRRQISRANPDGPTGCARFVQRLANIGTVEECAGCDRLAAVDYDSHLRWTRGAGQRPTGRDQILPGGDRVDATAVYRDRVEIPANSKRQLRRRHAALECGKEGCIPPVPRSLHLLGTAGNGEDGRVDGAGVAQGADGLDDDGDSHAQREARL